MEASTFLAVAPPRSSPLRPPADRVAAAPAALALAPSSQAGPVRASPTNSIRPPAGLVAVAPAPAVPPSAPVITLGLGGWGVAATALGAGHWGFAATLAAAAILAASQRRSRCRTAGGAGSSRLTGSWSIGRRPAVCAAATELAQTEAAVKNDVDPENLEFAKSMFDDVLGVKPPANLDVFLAVLQGSGYTLLRKDEWRQFGGDMHPFLLPLGYKGNISDADDDGLEVVGLLARAPNGQAQSPDKYQVVTQMLRKSRRVAFIGPDLWRYVAKRAEEANFYKTTADVPVIEATKDEYVVKFKGDDRVALDKWLLLEIGSFPDCYKNLALYHIANGEYKAGLVIAETLRDNYGDQWCFAHSFVNQVLRDNLNELDTWEDKDGNLQTRAREAMHAAQRCFTHGYPLWTLDEDSPEEILRLLHEAEMPKLSTLSDLRVFYLNRSVDEQRVQVRTGNMSLGCAAMAKGQALMDAVICGHMSYQGIRQELSELYDEVPGCEPLVELILYFKGGDATA